jgi:hypothetical protein
MTVGARKAVLRLIALLALSLLCSCAKLLGTRLSSPSSLETVILPIESEVQKNGRVSIPIFVSGDSSGLKILVQPKHGTVTLNTATPFGLATATYSPEIGFRGYDEFIYGVHVGPQARARISVVETLRVFDSKNPEFDPLPQDGLAEGCSDSYFDNNRLVFNGEKRFPFGFHGFYWWQMDEPDSYDKRNYQTLETDNPRDIRDEIDSNRGTWRNFSTWSNFAAYFSYVSTGANDSNRNDAIEANHLMMQVGGGISYSLQNGSWVQSTSVLDALFKKEKASMISALEVIHEPNQYTDKDDPRYDFATQASALRRVDSACLRPIAVVPTSGASTEYLNALRDATDDKKINYVSRQAYWPPLYAPWATYEMLKSWKREEVLGRNMPLGAVLKLYGYQSGRARMTEAVPTADAVRLSAYLALNADAFQISFYPFSSGGLYGGYQDPEGVALLGRYETVFNVLDSPDLFSGLTRLGTEWGSLNALLVSARPKEVDMGSAKVSCAFWSPSNQSWGASAGFYICGNGADKASPYFHSVSGATAYRLRAQAWTSEGVFVGPRYSECSDGYFYDNRNEADSQDLKVYRDYYEVDSDGDGILDQRASDVDPQCVSYEDHDAASPGEQNIYTSWYDSQSGQWKDSTPLKLIKNHVYLARLGSESTTKAYEISKVKFHFSNNPNGAEIDYAIYQDINRDKSPGKRVYQGKAFRPSVGWNVITLSEKVRVEPTTAYYLAIRPLGDKLEAYAFDERQGVRCLDVKERNGSGDGTCDSEYAELASSYPPLHTPLPQSISLPIPRGLHHVACLWVDQKRNTCDYRAISPDQDTLNFDLSPNGVAIIQVY